MIENETQQDERVVEVDELIERTVMEFSRKHFGKGANVDAFNEEVLEAIASIRKPASESSNVAPEQETTR